VTSRQRTLVSRFTFLAAATCGESPACARDTAHKSSGLCGTLMGHAIKVVVERKKPDEGWQFDHRLAPEALTRIRPPRNHQSGCGWTFRCMIKTCSQQGMVCRLPVTARPASPPLLFLNLGGSRPRSLQHRMLHDNMRAAASDSSIKRLPLVFNRTYHNDWCTSQPAAAAKMSCKSCTGQGPDTPG
jgi:hypothetical protein